MAVTLAPCVQQILCALSNAALSALKSIISGQIALLKAQILVFQTQLLQYDVLAIPVEVVQAAANAVVNKVRGAASLVPLNIISQCVDLGNFNLNLQQSIDVALATANDVLFEATRLLSYKTELNAVVANLNAAIDQFNAINTIIDGCLATPK